MKVRKPNKWDRRFFQMCALIASWSEDRSRKVGAVIVGTGNNVISTGHNGLPRSVRSIDARHEKIDGEKYYWFEHAERNALYNALRSGARTEGARIYTNIFPCADCARGIIQAGLVRLNAPEPPPNDPRYERSFEVSTAMFEEAEVEVGIFEI